MGLGPLPGGNSSALGVASSTVIKNGAGTLARISVTTAGAVGAVYDNNSTSTGNTSATLIAVVPATVGIYTLDWPCQTGITYVPGAAQVASISFE
jgi:hypothetical protein